VSSELTRRVLFGVAAAPIAVIIVFAGGAPLAALLAIASALAAWEFFRLARRGVATGEAGEGLASFDGIGVALAGIIPLIVHARYLGLYGASASVAPISLAIIALLALTALSIWTRGVAGKPIGAVASTAFGVAYTGGMLSFAYAIRYHEYAFGDSALSIATPWGSLRLASGGLLLLLPVLVTWASDIGGFAVGKAVGRHKLIPSVSPGKTVEGAVGGLAASVVVAWVYSRWVLHTASSLDFARPPWGALLFGAAVSAAAQLGDLAESLFKRSAGVKDSSNLIPGHGGVLDRTDSLLFVLPVAYLLMGWLLAWTPR
jgi:phosphatidate cytidylyltransferase